MSESVDDDKRCVSAHVPVMVKEVVECLKPQAGGIYVDGTLGMGGHSKALLKHIGPQGKLIGIDQDKRSLAEAKKNLSEFQDQCMLFHDSFRHIDRVLARTRIKQVDGILLDLGISSFQLADRKRGFSFQEEAPLDMRMNEENRIMAFDLINSLTEIEIAKILRDYGQERFHRRIAHNIVKKRALSPVTTTRDLREIVMQSMPSRWRREKIHPATRTFQAFRIAVNSELEEIETVLDKSMDLLKSGGRIVVIAFHSLEDKIVKEKFRLFAKMERARILTKKPLRPGEGEVEENSRARSARLRGAVRI